jgi:hypothetical protein
MLLPLALGAGVQSLELLPLLPLRLALRLALRLPLQHLLLLLLPLVTLPLSLVLLASPQLVLL